MKLVYVVDARSPIARNWIEYFVTRRHEVYIVSSYPDLGTEWRGVKVHSLPIGLNRWAHHKESSKNLGPSVTAWSQRLWRTVTSQSQRLSKALQHRLIGPFDAVRQGSNLRRLLQDIQPDLVHAMRIPYEGMLAASASHEFPLLISTWGNDFTLLAPSHAGIGCGTRRALRRADGLHTDCQRDQTLAVLWGFDPNKPSIVLPGAGGIQTDMFFPGEADPEWRQRLGVPGDALVVINPRGSRPYVRNDVFFRAIPIVLRQSPGTIFLCSAMHGDPSAEKWINDLGIAESVRLLPVLSRREMASVFRLADVSVSPSAHDGTPNTLLESMAAGCFPVAANIESVREWINTGENGFLYQLSDHEALAQAINHALSDGDLRQTAREHNLRVIAQRAEYQTVMTRAERFYVQLTERHRSG